MSRASTSAGPKPCGRGWQILRSQWKHFLQRRPEIPNRVLADMAPKEPPRPAGLSREAADRTMERMISQITGNTPRSLHKLEVYKKAEKVNAEVRAALDARGVPQSQRTSSNAAPYHEALFPKQWRDTCNETTLSELLIDAFIGDFCDALIDGAVVLVEAAQVRSATILPGSRGSIHSRCGSAGDLSLSKRRVHSLMPADSTADSRSRGSSAGKTGFTMAGLGNDSWDAWNRRKFHACKNIEPYLHRVHSATELQRPRRRLPPQESRADVRKFVWPMSATNFPEAWDSATSLQRIGPRPSGTASRAARVAAAEEAAQEIDERLMSIGRDGKTLFPYSLVSHRAFIESQPDIILKAKAIKLAPLCVTDRYGVPLDLT